MNGGKVFTHYFNKVEGYIKKYSTKHLALFHSNEKNEKIFGRIRYLIMLKSNISDVYFHKYPKIKINLDDLSHKFIKKC